MRFAERPRLYSSPSFLGRRFFTESCVIYCEFFTCCNVTQRVKCVISTTANIWLMSFLWLVKKPGSGHQAEISRTAVSLSVVLYDAKIFIQASNLSSQSFKFIFFHPYDWGIVTRKNGCSFRDCANCEY